uniref:Glycerophosphocholine phosphodiesterase 1 n=1 Tax=Oncorhynchus tshawytscha TaxID=74940 RepID=A0A8C8MDU4_ONCTS
METTQVTLAVRGDTSPGEVIAVVGSCEALGGWCHQRAVTLQPVEHDGTLWKRTVSVPRGAVPTYRYFKGHFLESKVSSSFYVRSACEVIGHIKEVTYLIVHFVPECLPPVSLQLLSADGSVCMDSGWLTCQTEIRLRLHFSKTSPVSITKKKYKKSRFRIKLTLEGVEEEDDEDEEPEQSAASWHKMTTTLETSMISGDGYKSRHSQPECGYALEASQWTEYIIHSMDPDNLELTFDFFEEDMGEHVMPGDAHPGTAGTACLLSSFFVESGKDTGVVTLPIMKRNSRQTLGKVRVDYLVIRPIEGLQCDMSSSFTKYWRKRSAPLDVGHRGAGSTHAAKHTKVRENTIASFKSAANHGAAYVEFDVHLSKDCVPIVYHDLTCCISTKKKGDKHSLELFEVPVKDLTYDQLQQLKVKALFVLFCKSKHGPTVTTLFLIVMLWYCLQQDGSWEGNLSSYFNMNLFLDIILSCVLQRAGKRRVVFSCFDPDVCTMVRQKQNKYPILFLTQGISETYPELMDIRCRTTQIAMSFAQSENILGISAHTEELLQNLEHIREAQSKGLVVFCWGDLNNDHDNRTKLREQGIDGLIYDRTRFNGNHPMLLLLLYRNLFKRLFLQDLILSDLRKCIHFRTGPPWDSNPQPWHCKCHALPTEPLPTELHATQGLLCEHLF